MSHDEAMRIMVAAAGVALDPTLFEEFRLMIDESGRGRPQLRVMSAA